jgi:molecular chaperone GrpE (heat shock protein)
MLLGFLPQQSYALTPVPDVLPAKQNAALKLHYSKLSEIKVALNSQIDQFTAKCSSVPEGSALENECAQEQSKLQVAKAKYKKDADTYERELVVAIDIELQAISNRIPKTRSELEKLTLQLQGFQASVDEWTNLAADARDKARQTAMENTATVLLDMLAYRNEAQTKLDEESLKRINAILRKRVFMDDLYAQVLTTERLDSLETDADVLNLVKRVKAALVLGSAIESKDREEALKSVLKGIEIAGKNPAITLLIADGEITIDAACGWLADNEAIDRVNQLLSLGEAQFDAVKVLTALYKKDIDNRKTLIAARPK